MAKHLVAGFDGFVDTIMRPVLQTATPELPIRYYPTISSLGEMLTGQKGKSCSIELEACGRRAGGNAPLLAAGAAALGMRATCIGMLGQPDIDPVFLGLPCELYSYYGPGQTTALEFGDGKVFLAPSIPPPENPWTLVQRATGGTAAHLLAEADAAAFLNWSEISFSERLWRQALDAIMVEAQPDMARWLLFDLCDCTRKGTESIDGVLRLMGKASALRTTLLSLNGTEAGVLGARLLGGETDDGQIAAALRERYGLHEVLVHTRARILLCTGRGTTTQTVAPVKTPLVFTGAGDHFNAASLYAAVEGMEDVQRLRFAGEFARRYLAGLPLAMEGFCP